VLIEFVVGVVFAAGTVWFVLQPVFRPGVEATAVVDGTVGDEGDDPDEDFSSRAVALRALREIEFDRATGKLSDADYEALKGKYTAEALAALRAEDREEGSGMRDAASATRAAAPLPASRIPSAACPTHGPRPEPDAAFCSDCGRRLGTAPGYCARCGSALEREARYCHGCGTRAAA
jgi:double zinc ribbon protein